MAGWASWIWRLGAYELGDGYSEERRRGDKGWVGKSLTRRGFEESGVGERSEYSGVPRLLRSFMTFIPRSSLLRSASSSE